MTKNDYEELAKSLGKSFGLGAVPHRYKLSIVEAIIEFLLKDNERFDKMKFVAAVDTYEDRFRQILRG
jgi:hypothetical protein